MAMFFAFPSWTLKDIYHCWMYFFPGRLNKWNKGKPKLVSKWVDTSCHGCLKPDALLVMKFVSGAMGNCVF